MNEGVNRPTAEVVRVTSRYAAARRNRPAEPVLKQVSLAVHPLRTVGLVGESGCGKSTLGRVMLKLLPVEAGQVRFEGRDITGLSLREMRPLRRRMQIVFQHPDSSFNPRAMLLDSLVEPTAIHRSMSRSDAADRARQLLDVVGLHPELLSRYPHQVSGGQLQRMALVRILMLEPKFIVLDEPTSMLDVSVQAQLVECLRRVQQEFGIAYLFISHDLDLIRRVSDDIAVMQGGRIVEQGTPEQIWEAPREAYTRALVEAFRF